MSTPLDNDRKPTSTNGRCPECDSPIFKEWRETRNTVECCSCRLIYIRLTGCEAFRYENNLKSRPTPETDSVFMTIEVGDLWEAKDGRQIAHDKCCDLERERDEARRQRDELLAALEDTKPLLIGIESDLGEPSHRRERAKRLLRAFESALAKVKGSR